MPSHRAVAAVLALAVAACSDATGTHDAVLVSLRADGTPTAGAITDAPNGPRIECSYNLSVDAKGHGTAVWQGTKVLLYAGTDLTKPVDSTTFTPSDASAIGHGLGSGYIKAGETQQSPWTISYAAPFEATIDLLYNMVGDRAPATVSAHVACGPPLRSAVAPGISWASVQTVPAPGLRTGDPVVIGYHETGATGIWKTVVDLSGAFSGEQVFGEHLATSADRSFTVIVPANGELGEPLKITVHAYDAALHETLMTLSTSATFVGP